MCDTISAKANAVFRMMECTRGCGVDTENGKSGVHRLAITKVFERLKVTFLGPSLVSKIDRSGVIQWERFLVYLFVK